MDDPESPLSHVSKSLARLNEKEKCYRGVSDGTPVKDYLPILIYGLGWLERLLSISTNEDLVQRINCLVLNVKHELDSLSDRHNGESLALDLDSAYSIFWREMKNVIIKPGSNLCDCIFPILPPNMGCLKTTNDYLLESIRILANCIADVIVPQIEEIEALGKKLKYLRALLEYVAGFKKPYITFEDNKLLTPLVALLDKATGCIYLSLVDKMDEETILAMKVEFCGLLKKTDIVEIYLAGLRTSAVPIENLIERKGSSDSERFILEYRYRLLYNLLKLLESNAESLNDTNTRLNEELIQLKDFLLDLEEDVREQKLYFLESSFEDVTRKAIPILCSCYEKQIEEDIAQEVDGSLAEVIKQIEQIKTEVKEIKLYFYPRTDGLGFLKFFLDYLAELMTCQVDPTGILLNQVKTLHSDFDYLISFLRIFQDKHEKSEGSDHLCGRIVHLAYQAEYAIDLFLVSATDSCIMSYLSKIAEEIKCVRSEVDMSYYKRSSKTQAGNKVHLILPDANTSSHVPLSLVTATQGILARIDGEVLGFENEAKELMEYLLGGEKELHAISIVGMPGLGKTTLAMSLYKAPPIFEHFHVLALCHASQSYQKRGLLLTILGQVISLSDDIQKLEDQEIADKLCRSLKRRRYLIFIDDIWDVKVWHDLKRYLPNDGNGSRILITSRYHAVGRETKGKVHALRELTEAESVELLLRKLPHEDILSENLLSIGKQIAASCKGLPLSIVIIAGLLSKVEKSEVRWNQIANGVTSLILADAQSSCESILQLSYNHLPEHLKSCFLYCRAFPNDQEISVSKLKWLWICEGFIRETKSKSLEDIAEEYVMDLIARSLVIHSRERSLKGVKTCRVHDLLRDFCSKKAEEEYFMSGLHEEGYIQLDDPRRLCWNENYVCFGLASFRSSLHAVRSLIMPRALTMDVMELVFKKMKLLKVLDISTGGYGERIDKSTKTISCLIHMRYLAVESTCIPIISAIMKLRNLEVLILSYQNAYLLDGKAVSIPDSIWEMVKLRHVHIRPRSLFHIEQNQLQRNSSLENLLTLSKPCLSYGDEEKVLKRFPKLQELSCIFVDSSDDSLKCHLFPVLECLNQLTSLKVEYGGHETFSKNKRRKLYLPPNLKKLTLSGFKLYSEDISEIGVKLPYLEVLKLYTCGRSSRRSKWSVNDEDFPRLKYLKLQDLRFEEWTASEDSFHCLEQLLLDTCNDLEEIPMRFGEVPNLRMIKVNNCRPSVEHSAREIENQQFEEQNMELKVYIYPKKSKASSV